MLVAVFVRQAERLLAEHICQSARNVNLVGGDGRLSGSIREENRVTGERRTVELRRATARREWIRIVGAAGNFAASNRAQNWRALRCNNSE